MTFPVGARPAWERMKLATFFTLVLVSLNDGIHGSEKICSKFVVKYHKLTC